MKVVDPQAALLTNSEVYNFLKSNSPRKPDKKSGAYDTVRLQDYLNIRKDFERYIDLTAPHIKDYPPPEEFLNGVVKRFRKYDLTKTEVLTLINLGLGMPRSRPVKVKAFANGHTEVANAEKDGSDEAQDQMLEEGTDEPNYRALVDCVIESVGERFAGEAGELKLEEIITVLKECIGEANAS